MLVLISVFILCNSMCFMYPVIQFQGWDAQIFSYQSKSRCHVRVQQCIQWCNWTWLYTVLWRSIYITYHVHDQVWCAVSHLLCKKVIFFCNWEIILHCSPHLTPTLRSTKKEKNEAFPKMERKGLWTTEGEKEIAREQKIADYHSSVGFSSLEENYNSNALSSNNRLNRYCIQSCTVCTSTVYF